MDLARFAETLLSLMGPDTENAVAVITASLARFDERYLLAYEAGMRRKLGLNAARGGDLALGQDLLTRMAQNLADMAVHKPIGDNARKGAVRRKFNSRPR
jgi:uncharacterized protein YdiU (UPF0061 family)